VKKLVSEDAVRRALKQARLAAEVWEEWLSANEMETLAPLLEEDYVLDVDTTIKPLYGHQQGAELGYNPTKPGRPSHAIHTAFIGALRLIFSVDVQSGKRHAACHLAPGLWRRLHALARHLWPTLLRGDVGFGNEDYMRECEARRLDYLFKLRRSPGIRTLTRKVAALAQEAWEDADDGWQTCEARVRLTGWSWDPAACGPCFFRWLSSNGCGVACSVQAWRTIPSSRRCSRARPETHPPPRNRYGAPLGCVTLTRSRSVFRPFPDARALVYSRS